MNDTQLRQLTTALADRYQVVRTIGRGGMATVYLAGIPTSSKIRFSIRSVATLNTRR